MASYKPLISKRKCHTAERHSALWDNSPKERISLWWPWWTNTTTCFKSTWMGWTQTLAPHLMRLLSLYVLESSVHMQRVQLIHGLSLLKPMVYMQIIHIYLYIYIYWLHRKSLRNSPPENHPAKGIAQLLTWESSNQKDTLGKNHLRNQISTPTKKVSTMRKFCIS